MVETCSQQDATLHLKLKLKISESKLNIYRTNLKFTNVFQEASKYPLPRGLLLSWPLWICWPPWYYMPSRPALQPSPSPLLPYSLLRTIYH